MNKKLLGILPLILIFIIGFFIWALAERSESFQEPNEALLANDQDLVLIPGYKHDDRALFFFIKNETYLGAAYVHKRIFGWKAGMLTWSSLDRNNEGLDSYSGHGDHLIYGLIRHGDERLIQVGEHDAKMLNLEMLPQNKVEQLRLKGLYLWYFEGGSFSDRKGVKLIDKNNGEEIDSL
ncbi:hypothetical protein [Sporosarcina sp. HYO08]|uniref:hypothetical protein n=1 Tax=Sporosarcina sp. HYO08 TaxID=1759557 RepID=UPI000796F509|nr:hypothetical protein [Sporosarcina sp. HYO08]KXH81938.1 hypothetical protein AU377_06680 [Sporosarcina sp. HYO08]